MSSIEIHGPTRHMLQFLPGGTYHVKADCNLSTGKYVLEGSSIKLGPIAMTRTACTLDSLAGQYVARLGNVVIFVQRAANLCLNL